MKTWRTGAVAGLVAVIIAGALAGTASAQIYPQPSGYCVISLSDPLPPVDAEVTLTITAADRAGNALDGVSGDVTIVEQPGDDARVQPGTFTTGANGTAEVILYTGTEPGLVRVSSPCGDAQVTANVNVGQPPGPPSTGTGASDADTTVPVAAGVIGAVGAVMLTGGVAALRRRRERS